MEKNVTMLILGGIIVVLSVIVVYLGVSSSIFIGFGTNNVLPKEEAGSKTIDFIRENFASPDIEMEILEIKEVSGIYEMKFDWDGQEQMAYITKDAKYLFPQLYDMKPPEPKSFSKSDKPEVNLFVMSYCPFGNQAEEIMMPVIDLLGDNINIELHYIIYNDYATGYPEYCLDPEKTYCSMHGVEEVNQGIRELCVQKYDPDKFWNFIEQTNIQTTEQDIEEKWQGIATSLGIDTSKIEICQKDEGVTLLKQELDRTSALYPVQNISAHGGEEQSNISGSPTMVINGMIYDGERSADAYKEAICSAMENPVAECEQDLTTNDTAPNGSCE